MSNSPLVTYTRITTKKTSPRNHKIDTITIHCYVGQVTAKQGCDYFATTTRNCSSNYVVGRDGSIGLCVDEKDRSWCSGGVDAKGNPIRVNGISGSDNDHRAITIEVSCDTTAPYAVTDEAYKALIDLVADICKRNNIKQLLWKADKSLVGKIDEQNITVHRWFAATACPGDYLYSHMGSIADEVNNRLQGDNTKMDMEMFIKLFNEYRDTLKDNDADSYSEEARNWAVSTGLIKGSGVNETGEPNNMWQDFLTREQLVTVLYRFAKLIGKA